VIRWHVVAALLVMGCGPGSGPFLGHRDWTDDMSFQIASDPTPPRARQNPDDPYTIFTVDVRDKATGQPIEGGEGRIYANTRDGARTWDGLTPTNKPGTYTAKLKFVISGDWAMGLQFRRDSTKADSKIETLNSWVQEVSPATGEQVH
jgi:hypothetical protein